MKHFFIVVVLSCFSSGLFSQTAHAYGQYIGTGAELSITGLGFRPEVLIIKANDVYEAVITTNQMPAGDAKGMGSSLAMNTTSIKQLDGDGFTVLTDDRANKSGVPYHWVAFAAGANVVTGTYTGSAATETSGKTVTGLSFTPESVWIWGRAANIASTVTISLASATHADMGYNIKDGVGAQWDWVNAFNADGFTTESTAGRSPVADGVVYYWIAFNDNGAAAKTSTYTDADFTDGEVKDLGLTPDFIIICDQNATSVPAWRTPTLSGDQTLSFAATAAVSNAIQSLSTSPTGIEVGTNSRVATDGSIYSYIAFSGGVSLPVELVSFDAKIDKEEVHLEWSTASEINSSYFEVMRSADGQTFNNIGNVEAAGTSNAMLYYEYKDISPLDGLNYYKLIEHDFDEKTQESQVVAVNFTSQLDLITELYPNPSVDNVLMYFNSDKGGLYKLQIVDMKGDALYFAHIPAMIGENKFYLSFRNYSAGNYLLKLTDPKGKSSSTQFIKSE